MLGWATEHAVNRKQFGQSLTEFGLIQEKLTSMGNASNNIKRVYKGYKARNQFRIKRGGDYEQKQLLFFHEMATIIQK